MIHTFKDWVEKHFNLCLFLSFLAGLVLPYLDRVPDDAVLWLVGFMIFFATARMSVRELEQVDVFHIGLFFIGRFLLLPLLLFGAVYALLPELAAGTLLLALMPAGVSLAALCAINGGNVALGLGLTLVSSLLAPVTIPAVFHFTGSYINVDVWGLFLTLVLIVFLPAALYAFFAWRSRLVRHWTQDNAKFGSILILCFLTALIIAKKRDVLLTEPMFFVVALLALFALFAAFYFFGMFVAMRAPRNVAITYILGSGVMNNALGIALAFTYFDSKTTLFLVMSDIAWTFSLMLYQWWLRKQSS